MKYLKTSDDLIVENIINDVRLLSDDCLAYLIDDRICSVSFAPYNKNLRDRLVQVILHIDEKSWDDIKDYIIPYIEIMNNNYHLVNNIGDEPNDTVGFSHIDYAAEEQYYNYASIDNILNDNLEFIGTSHLDGQYEEYIDKIEFVIERKRRV